MQQATHPRTTSQTTSTLSRMHEELHRLRGMVAKGLLAEAREFGMALYRSGPATSQLLRLLGQLHYTVGDTRFSSLFFSELLHRFGGTHIDHYNFGMVLQQQGDKENALMAFENAISLKADFAEAHLARGNLLMTIGRQADAVAAFLAAARFPRLSHDALYNLAMAYADLGLLPAAVQALKNAAAAKPDDVHTLTQLGLLLLRGHHLEEAAEILQRALLLAPKEAVLHEKLGDIHLQCGVLEKAITSYRQTLGLSPRNCRAMNNLGLALLLRARAAEAIPILRESIAIDGTVAETWFNLGNALMAIGDRQEAALSYQEAIRLQPGHADAWFNLGFVQQKRRRFNEAEAAYRQALALDGRSAMTLFNLAVVQQAMDRHDEAIVSYRRSLDIAPGNSLAHYNLGIALQDSGRVADAVESFRAAHTLAPQDVRILNNLGLALGDIGDFHQAEAAFRKAMAISPGFADVYSNLGNLCQQAGRVEEAMGLYEKAVLQDPLFAKAYYNQGCLYLAENRAQQAETKFRKAIEVDPELVEAHWNLSHALLLQGKLEEGFREYRWRWRRQEADVFVLPLPKWNGEPCKDGGLLVLSEQGKGDAIQFVRFLPQVRRRVGKILLVCDLSLRELFAGLPAVDKVIDKKEVVAACREVNGFVPLLDLPEVLGTTAATLPDCASYLTADPALVENCAGLFAANHEKLRVGIVWRGNPNHKNDHNRSCSPEFLAPLCNLEGIALFSLQKSESPPPVLAGIVDLAPAMTSFAATAALMAHLDLIISVDTAVAHLAGALGRPVWTLLPFVPDWRWMLERSDTPWYPTMRLFRQSARRSWEEVIAAVTDALLPLRNPHQSEQ